MLETAGAGSVGTPDVESQNLADGPILTGLTLEEGGIEAEYGGDTHFQ